MSSGACKPSTIQTPPGGDPAGSGSRGSRSIFELPVSAATPQSANGRESNQERNGRAETTQTCCGKRERKSAELQTLKGRIKCQQRPCQDASIR